MDGQPITVTNDHDRDAPADLVVLDVMPKDVTREEATKILGLDWFVPDVKHHEEFVGVILVRWDEFAKIKKGATPLSPAEVGLDNLKAVVLTPAESHMILIDFHTTYDQE